MPTKPKVVTHPLLSRYESRKIKCLCKKQAKLIYTTCCYYVCRSKEKCTFIRRFQDVYDDYLDETKRSDRWMLKHA